MRCRRARAVTPVLVENASPAENAAAGRPSLGLGIDLRRLDPRAEHAREFIGRHVRKLRRADEGQRDRGGHGTVLAKEEVGAHGGDAPTAYDGFERVDTRPVHDTGDQIVLHGVGQGIDHLVEHVAGVDQAKNAGLLRRPEVLPAAAEHVHALGEQLVEVLDEVRVLSEGIENAGVVVVRLSGGEQHLNAGAQRCDGQTVDEGVVRGLIGPEEKLTLGAAPGDHVDTAGKDFSRKRHTDLSD